MDTGGGPLKIHGDAGEIVAEVVADTTPLPEPIPLPTPDPAFPTSSVTVLNQVQVIYDQSPKLRIRGSGFDVVEAEHILLNIGAAGQPSLVSDRDFVVEENEQGDGIILKLLPGKTWVDLSNLRPPVAIVLREVRFGSLMNVNVLYEPIIVAQVLSVPSVNENSALTLRQTESTLIIHGAGLVGAKKVDFYFNPPLVKEVAYEDISQYPLIANRVTLRLRGGYKWRDEPGPLLVIGADTGGGPVRYAEDGEVVATVIADNVVPPTESTCENTCIYPRDGVCDDPRGTNYCAAGTDCQDCGPSGAPVNNTGTGTGTGTDKGDPTHKGDQDDYWTFNDDNSVNRTDGNPPIHRYTPHKENDDLPMFLILVIALPLIALLGVAIARCTMLETNKPETGVAMSVRPSTSTYTPVDGDCEGGEGSVAANVVHENGVSYV